MRWLWFRKFPTDDSDVKIERATEKVEDIASRGDVVARKLEGRLVRNHWGEAVAAIARREDRRT